MSATWINVAPLGLLVLIAREPTAGAVGYGYFVGFANWLNRGTSPMRDRTGSGSDPITVPAKPTSFREALHEWLFQRCGW